MLKTNKPWTRVLSTALALCMLLSLLPVSVVFLCLQKYFIEGIATSGLKG